MKRTLLLTLCAVFLARCYDDGMKCEKPHLFCIPGDEPDLLWEHNAQISDGCTHRWNSEIRVWVADPRVKSDLLQGIFDELNLIINPVELVFAESESRSDLIIRFDPAMEFARGHTNTHWNSSNIIHSAYIRMGDFGHWWQYYHQILKHELIHALGFHGHTPLMSGEVMDPNAYACEGVIGPVTFEVLSRLYGMPPCTHVCPTR